MPLSSSSAFILTSFIPFRISLGRLWNVNVVSEQAPTKQGSHVAEQMRLLVRYEAVPRLVDRPAERDHFLSPAPLRLHVLLTQTYPCPTLSPKEMPRKRNDWRGGVFRMTLPNDYLLVKEPCNEWPTHVVDAGMRPHLASALSCSAISLVKRPTKDIPKEHRSLLTDIAL